MSNYHSHNVQVLKHGLEQYSEVIASKIAAVCREAVQELYDEVDRLFSPKVPSWISKDGQLIGGSDDFPIWTGQLRNSTGAAVYWNGVIYSLIQNPLLPNEPQDYNGQEEIYGDAWLQNAIEQGYSKYGRGLWIVLFSAVPYAAEIDLFGSVRGRGMNYFEKLKDIVKESVMNGLMPLVKEE